MASLCTVKYAHLFNLTMIILFSILLVVLIGASGLCVPSFWSAGWRLSIMPREQEDSVVDTIQRTVHESVEAANQRLRFIALAFRNFFCNL